MIRRPPRSTLSSSSAASDVYKRQLVENEVRRHLEQEIAEKEDAGAEAEYGRRETQVLVHSQRREANVDAVDEGNEVEQHHEGNDAQGDLAQRARFQLGTHSVGSSPDLYCF